MFRTQLPRIYELWDLISDPASPDAYFPQNFETLLQTSLPMAAYTHIEKKLQYLDVDAWKPLRDEASQYLTVKDPKRGWQQLFENLEGPADAYKHLRDLGCSDVCFIPRSQQQGQRTPDLEGLLDSRRVLCEVKTINISEAEVSARAECTVRDGRYQLDDAFFRKLQSDITKANGQLHAYDAMGKARHIVYVSIYFDDWGGRYSEEYRRQIDQYLKGNPIHGSEVAFSARS